MENIVLHLKLVRGIRGALMAYLVQRHIMVAHITLGYGAYLNLDEEMITRAPIIDSKMNLMFNQEILDRVCLDYLCATFKINNALVYQILSNMFMYIDAYVYAK